MSTYSFMALPMASVFSAFGQSNTAGKVIAVILFSGSIVVWSIMAAKLQEVLRAQKSCRRFLAAYRKTPRSGTLLRRARSAKACPLATLYAHACKPIAPYLEEDCSGDHGLAMSPVDLKTIESIAGRTAADQALALEDGMGFLATATTTAPFLGLLGTVWGVMEAFMGMGETALLSAVAPGISGALMTTVVGLMVALPSAIGYNTLNSRIRALAVMMDNFSQELVTDLEQHAAECRSSRA